MAIVKDRSAIGEASKDSATAFEIKYKPGDKIPLSGIYRCAGCGDEYALNKGGIAPPQNHHQHPLPLGGIAQPIEWQLFVFAQTK